MIGLLLVLVLRIVSAILIVIFPFAGYLSSVFMDIADLWIFEMLGSAYGVHYPAIDKTLDLVTLVAMLYVSRRFIRFEKKLAAGLFGWRMAGTVLFLVSDHQALLFIFPNVFESFFLFCILRSRFFTSVKTEKSLWWILPLVIIPKLAHEWFLHISGMDMSVYLWVVDTIDRLGLRIAP